jgi:hypothetical protein
MRSGLQLLGCLCENGMNDKEKGETLLVHLLWESVPFIPGFVGFLILILLSYLNLGIDLKPVTSLAFFLWGVTGIFWIKRREIPNRIGSYTGVTAIVLGTIWTPGFWGFALYLLLLK